MNKAEKDMKNSVDRGARCYILAEVDKHPSLKTS